MISWNRQTFGILYPTYDKFKEKIIDKAIETLGNPAEIPFYLDDSKRPFKKEFIYYALKNNGANNWLSLNEESIQNGKMINWYISISIKLTGNLINLQKEFLEKLNASNLLSNLQDTYQIDGDNKFNIIENIYTELPSSSNTAGRVNQPKNKSVTKQINKSHIRQEFIDISESIKKATFNFADAISTIINNKALKKMWDTNPDNEALLKIEGLIDLTNLNKLLLLKIKDINNLEVELGQFNNYLVSLAFLNKSVNDLKAIDNNNKLAIEAELANLKSDLASQIIKINLNSASYTNAVSRINLLNNSLIDKLNKTTYDNHILDYETLKIKVNTIESNVGHINEDKIKSLINDWHSGLNFNKKGVYKDLGGSLTNDDLKNVFDGGDGNNDEYLVLNDIINNFTFPIINAKEQFGLIKGNWLIDHLNKRNNLKNDFSFLFGTTKILFIKKVGKIEIYFYNKNNKELHLITKNTTTDNYENILHYRADSPSYVQKIKELDWDWINDEKVLNGETPIFINDEFKKLRDAFLIKLKNDIEGDLKYNIPIFAITLKNDTNSIINNNSISDNNSKDHVTILKNNLEFMNENPLTFKETQGKIELNFNFKKELSGGIYELLMLIDKDADYWIELEAKDPDIRAKYLYQHFSNYSADSRIGKTWRKEEGSNNQIISRASGRQIEIKIVIGNNGTLWIYRDGTKNRSYNWESYGTHQVYHLGEIWNTQNISLTSKTLTIIFKKVGVGSIHFKKNSIFSLKEIIGG